MKSKNSLFSYRNTDSLIHKMPAWVKLCFLLLVTLRIFSASGSQIIIWARLGFYFTICLTFWILAKTPFSSLLKLRFLLYLGLLLFSISLINHSPIKNDLLYILRFLITMLASTVVFETTSRMEIMDLFYNAENVVGRVIPPFKKLNLSLVFSVSLTFIPEVFECWNRVMLAASARTPVNSKGRRVFSISALQSVLTAFFLNMLHYADDLRRAINNRR